MTRPSKDAPIKRQEKLKTQHIPKEISLQTIAKKIEAGDKEGGAVMALMREVMPKKEKSITSHGSNAKPLGECSHC
jgi:hypothetical protein